MKQTTTLVICALLGVMATIGGVGQVALGVETGPSTSFAQPSLALPAKSPHQVRLTQKKDAPVLYSAVAAIFSEHCIMCHSGPKPPNKLRLDNYADAMKGGKNGPVIIPGNPTKSELIRRVRGQSKPRMPFNGPPWLTEKEITEIERWIATGAPEGISEASRAQSRPGGSPRTPAKPKAIPLAADNWTLPVTQLALVWR
jgi:hypothetical protein